MGQPDQSQGQHGENRKGRRELSTSKRAAQNRAAQVGNSEYCNSSLTVPACVPSA
ncbi:hypothetical protein M011DRAFT_468501 [Sporormia fimetaria CBS 119925]|uniref:Uncharacterized protein n=1 Tax=Sporormia fimetaria CBS 119925 TaxID=1340428 RepID=A0A6A6V8I1_9PLEO|nr:hypothetical protein M011DRAFT_468501 [Sporormia fimetaria CBS 119925]